MTPQRQPRDAFELFQAHFDQLLNPQHPLVRLADQIDWPRFETAFADCYCKELGAPGKAIRLMVGLHYLKYTFNESDESVLDRWVENPYWQCFCGYTHMQHELPHRRQQHEPLAQARRRRAAGVTTHRNDRVSRARKTTAQEGSPATHHRHHRSREEHHLSDRLEAALHRDPQAGPSRQAAQHPSATVVPSGRQTSGGQSRSLRPRQTVQAHAQVPAQATHLRGAVDPGHSAKSRHD
ncbi:MAG: transposase [bacterium]|nr:transposase [bacterium]